MVAEKRRIVELTLQPEMTISRSGASDAPGTDKAPSTIQIELPSRTRITVSRDTDFDLLAPLSRACAGDRDTHRHEDMDCRRRQRYAARVS
jgi:hypothetical protein